MLHWQYGAFSQEVYSWCYIGNTVCLARKFNHGATLAIRCVLPEGLITVLHWQYGAFSQEV